MPPGALSHLPLPKQGKFSSTPEWNEASVYSLGAHCWVRARVIIHTLLSISISQIFKVKAREFIAALGNAEGAPQQ